MEEEIRAKFKESGFTVDEEDEVLKKCLTFCIQYKLSPSDLVLRWDAFSLPMDLGLTVKNADMDAFLLHLQNEQKEAIIKEESGMYLYSNDVTMILDDEPEGANEGTPVAKPMSFYDEPFDSAGKSNGYTFNSGKPLVSVTPFGQRKSKFVVQSTLNNPPKIDNIKIEQDHEMSEDDFIRTVQPSSRCSLVIDSTRPEPGCKFMYDKIENKFNMLENRIVKYGEALVASGLCEEPVDPTIASQKSVFAVGMICCEEEGRLKEKPILLQCSVEHSGGQRVRLDLQQLSHFSIFPGQVVGIQGYNPSGHCFIATKIIDSLPLLVSSDENLHPSKKRVVESTDPSHARAELSLIISAGPYTTTDNLLFEPLTELLAYACRKQPQLLVLLGPFIDSEHPEIKKGNLDRTFDEMFRVEILGRLHDYVEYMGSAARVVLVPSIRDASHDFVFPQPPFELDRPDLENQITCLTNPGVFSANKVKIGCCTVDILKQLSAEEISRNPQGGSKQRMSRLANHLISQRSFHPLYPPAESVPLDSSLAPEALQISSVPDILILSSDLTHFVKLLSLGEEKEGEEQVKCICVNPGRIARGEGAGFFVELNYNGGPDSSHASVLSI